LAGYPPISDPFKGKPWMYSMPRGPNQLREWREAWGKAILGWAEENNVDLVAFSDLLGIAPLNRLGADALREIIESLRASTFAEYWKNDKSLVRIHWRSLELWAERVLEEARRGGKNVIYGLEGVYDLVASTRKLPVEDVEKILDLLVEMKSARWLEKENLIVKIA